MERRKVSINKNHNRKGKNAARRVKHLNLKANEQLLTISSRGAGVVTKVIHPV